MSSGEDQPPKGRDRRLLLVAAGTALSLIVLIVITTARNTPILHAPERDPNIHIRYGTYTPPTPPGGTRSYQTRPSRQHGSSALGTVLTDVMLGLLLLGLLWVLAAVVVSLIRRWRHRRHVQHAGPLPDVDDAVLDAVTEATHRQRQRLHEGTPSNAIIACWVDLEQSVAAAGVRRRPSETSAELTIRVLDALDIDRPSLRTLGALYREARYSQHPVSETDRAAALKALHTLQRSLPTTQERV
ncbi:DUF4129 domain-containing protein [Flexivirga endophytica]|uniref:DUF4129 domain-containing protein n=1 Tax=Flexivirga endophytica TaxID=1849103 RepID=UPI00166D41FA|nr:DUF4129 domain-containing protein [Flexivirga endophytica]